MSEQRSSEAAPKQNPVMSAVPELSAQDLRLRCDTTSLNFETTRDLPPLQNVLGQPRALRALELGSAIAGPGFNIFALGLPDSGRTKLIRDYLERKAATEPAPDDWCYLNNFTDPRQPKALRLPAGRGAEFRADVESLLTRLAREIPQAFESDEYSTERDRLLQALKKGQEAEFSRLAEQAARHNFAIGRGPFGIIVVPAAEGKPIPPEELEKLTPQQIEELEKVEAMLREQVNDSLDRARDMARETYERLEDLNSRTASFVIAPLIDRLKAKYAALSQVTAHLDVLKADLVANAAHFRPASGGGDAPPESEHDRARWFRRYAVNLLVNNAELRGAPVITENQPSYHNLLGRVEHEVVMGGSQTDFTMIRPGALHRANGGYLIVPARDVLINPYAWEGLKRVLRDGAIRIIELGTELSLLSTVALEPEPIPLKVKVVLIGTPTLYYLLAAYDEDFAKLFKVKAEFTTSMRRSAETEYDYALFVKSVIDQNQLPAFDRGAVAAIIEYGARAAGEKMKLSTRFGQITNLIQEAAYWAGKEGQQVVTESAVRRAVEEGIYRNNLLEERFQELITEGTLMIDTRGTAVGQVNGLSVLMLGDYAFGHPTRLTASARPGRGGIIDIERRAELGGPIHTKGVLIIEGLLGARYGRKQPLTLSASLAFEQSYEGVEGDSASAAECVALLSAIAEIPLRQDRAITGSVNQHGQIQAIGGVNEKIEGFFAICKAHGLTGSQGVIIPQANVRNLMLRDEVIEAVRAGQFHIWPITTIDHAIALLSDTPPGERGPDGAYPEGTFNHAVVARLAEFARAAPPPEHPEGERKDR